MLFAHFKHIKSRKITTKHPKTPTGAYADAYTGANDGAYMQNAMYIRA